MMATATLCKKQRKTITITNHRRFAAFCAVCILGLLLLLNTAATANRNIEFYQLTVSAGDTLWAIAHENNPKSKDVRRVIDEIKRYNQLEDTTLYVSQQLLIPVQ